MLGLIEWGVKKLGNHFFPDSMDEGERAQKEAELTVLLQEFAVRDREAQRDVLVAELTQGDAFTKRARPWMIYSGLIIVGVNSILFVFLNGLVALFKTLEPGTVTFAPIAPPPEFWLAWGGATSLYVWRRDTTKQLGMKLARGNGNGV